MKTILGIDIGGVIIDRVNENTDTSFFSGNYLQSVACQNAFEKILACQSLFDDIHLVSKCGQKTQEKTMQWLRHNRFFARTGVLAEEVHFCRERHEKKGICEKLGITHFIDDRLEVLSYLIGTVPNLYLFCPQEKEKKKFEQHLYSVTVVNSWDECFNEMAVNV